MRTYVDRLGDHIDRARVLSAWEASVAAAELDEEIQAPEQQLLDRLAKACRLEER